MTDKLPSSVTNLFKNPQDIKAALQAFKDQNNFAEHCALEFMTYGEKVWTIFFMETHINGALWKIVSPADRSMYIALTEDIGATDNDNVWRQYVMPNEVRDPVMREDARWWYIPLDGFNPEERAEGVSMMEHANLLDKFHDLIMLNTTSAGAVDACERVVLSRKRSDSDLNYAGSVYSKRTGSIAPKIEQAFIYEPKDNHPWMDIESGYYWLAEPGKPNTVVWIKDEENRKVLYHTSDVSNKKRLLNGMSKECVFTKIADDKRNN